MGDCCTGFVPTTNGAGGGGGSGGESVVTEYIWTPSDGGNTGPVVFSSFTALYAALAATRTSNPAYVFSIRFEAPTGYYPLPAGAYDMTRVTWIADPDAFVQTGGSDGGAVTGLVEVIGVALVEGPFLTFTGNPGETYALKLTNVVVGGGANPGVITIMNGQRLDLQVNGQTAFGSGAIAVGDESGQGFVNIRLFSGRCSFSGDFVDDDERPGSASIEYFFGMALLDGPLTNAAQVEIYNSGPMPEISVFGDPTSFAGYSYPDSNIVYKLYDVTSGNAYVNNHGVITPV